MSDADIASLIEGQNVMLEMLRTFDGICRRHKIRYWADSGTLLGIVRHKVVTMSHIINRVQSYCIEYTAHIRAHATRTHVLTNTVTYLVINVYTATKTSSQRRYDHDARGRTLTP